MDLIPPLENIPFYQTHFKEKEEGIERKEEGKKYRIFPFFFIKEFIGFE